MSIALSSLVRAVALAAVLCAAAPAAAQVPADDELAGWDRAPAAPPPSSSVAAAESAAAPERPAPRRRAEIRPYLEVNLGSGADLSGAEDDVVTYASAALGVDGRVETRRAVAQASYRYERRIPIDGADDVDENVHSGVAMVHLEAAPGLSLDAGALAAQTGGQGLPAAAPNLAGGGTQLFSGYAGPTLNYNLGPVTLGAAYRFGYVRVEDDALAGDRFDDSIVHNATASIGMGPGRLPFGWTIGGGYVREESGELDAVFEGRYVRGDVVLPLGPTFALTAGIGYETHRSSSDDVLRDANGIPVLVDGRLVRDPARPRLVGLDRDGLIYDGGFLWRPGPRTELQGRAGRRYGGTTIIGSLRHRFRRGWGVNADLYDMIGTSSTQIVSNINQLPRDFTVNRNPLTGAFDGCVFGRDPGTGICFDQALASLRNSPFRARGANLLFSGGGRVWNVSLGGGYAHRRYREPVSGDLASLDPQSDQSVTLNAGLGRRLGRSAGLSLDGFASWYDSDRPLVEPVTSAGFTGSFYRSFLLDRLQLHAALGLYRTDGIEDSTILSALAGLRYSF